MANRPRIPIRGVTHHSSVGRVINEFASGERTVRPLVEYQRRPLEFLTTVLRIPRHTLVWSENDYYDGHTWDGTPDPLLRACQVLAGEIPGKRHVAIEAATGTQKTYTAAGLVLWFLACFEDSLVVTTAPKEKQLKEGLWKEIGAHLQPFRRRFPHMQAIELKIRMRPTIADPFGDGLEIRQEKWSAVGWCAGVDAGAESAVRSQGFHAEHMLVVVEEMPGMDPAIVTALKNTCTAPHNVILGLGNPDNQHDPLHLFAGLGDVERIQISAFDHPNVVCNDPQLVPGATSRDFIAAKLEEYGEGGPLFLSRVRGQSPTEAADALIKREWCETAIARGKVPEIRVRLLDGFAALGVDVANSEAGDKAAIARGKGRVLKEVEERRCPDANKLGAAVVDEARASRVRPDHVGIDSVGVGAGAVNEAKRLQFLVKDLNGGARAIPTMDEDQDVGGDRQPVRNAEKFANLRAQMHWQLREDLRLGHIILPDDQSLVADLVTPKFWTKNGTVWVEPKEEIKKRLGRSPNKGDAAVYWNWVRDRSNDQTEPVEQDDANPITPEMWQQHVERQMRPRRRQYVNGFPVDEAPGGIELLDESFGIY